VGTCPAGKQPLEIKGSLPDPAWTLTREFEDYLRKRGIPVQGLPEETIILAWPLPPPEEIPDDTVRLGEHLSPDLAALAAVVNGYSDNLYAAQLLAMVGEENRAPNSAGGLEALLAWLNKQGIPDLGADFHLVDGNGLSRRNRLTPAGLTRLLGAFSAKPWFPAWRETLLGGKICPLKPGAYAEGLWGKVWVKTGSMEGVASLTGYIQAKSGRLLAFTVVINHFEGSPISLRNRWGALLRHWTERY
jgi:D-alanyl-D-alanine carboxypeptidase/D-alanyl-D-alanine-endopeptidase (penicillin-binding protein 4)